MTVKAKLTSKGQITIPAEVRTALGLREGDTVTFELQEEGKAVLRPVRDSSVFEKYAGALREGKNLSAKDIVETLKEERGW